MGGLSLCLLEDGECLQYVVWDEQVELASYLSKEDECCLSVVWDALLNWHYACQEMVSTTNPIIEKCVLVIYVL